MQIEYRLARMDDLDEVFALVRLAIARMEENGVHQWDELYPDRATLQEDICKQEMRAGIVEGHIAVIYVLNRDCDPEYSDALWTQPDVPHMIVHRLCVHPNLQHKGIAGATMRHIEQEALSLGVQSLRLDVFSQNPYALRLYESRGFAVTGHADWRKGRFLIMEKII